MAFPISLPINLSRRLRRSRREVGESPVDVYVVPHTHWDREWYLPFEEFRARLIETVDGLLDLLERDERFSYFTLDGQVVLLDDYLEARPERRDEIRRLVRAGRLMIGPWYVMPDEFLVSAESLVRNLQRGVEAAESFGGAMRVGYVPDTFGHVAQLPQILRGFGIDSAVLWRGVGPEVRQNEFRWRAPDGEEVLVLFLRHSYANAENLPTGADELLDRLDLLRRGLESTATDRHLLLMNGGDHAAPQPELPDIIATANGRVRGARLVLGTLPAYLDSLRRASRDRGLEVVEGELRSPAHAPLLTGVLSSRLWIKQRNAATQTLLEAWAEPFAVFAGQLDSARPLLRLAWRHLLLCHPHDSICGSSIDQVHEEMRVRFDRSDQLAGRVTDSALRALAARIDTGAAAQPSGAGPDTAAGYLAVFNPGDGPRSDFVEASIAPPSPAFALADARGEVVPYQTLGREADDALVATIPRAQVETHLKLAGNGEGWRLRVIERALTAVARVAAPELIGLGLVGYSIREPRKRGVLDVEIRGAPVGHDYAVVGRLIRELRARLDRGQAIAVRFHVRKTARVRLGFVARDLPARGYRLYQLLPSPETQAGGPGQPSSRSWASRLFDRLRGKAHATTPPSEPPSLVPTVQESDVGDPPPHGVEVPPAYRMAEAEEEWEAGKRDAGALTPALSQGERGTSLPVRGSPPNGGEGGEGARPIPEGDLEAGHVSLSNEYFAVRVDPEDGTLTVEDLLTGETYPGLGALVDSGDAGDEYNYSPPPIDLVVDRPAAVPSIELVESGPVRQTVRIGRIYLVPASLDEQREGRSAERVELATSTLVSLAAGVRRVDFETTVENTARDHLLRARFPTGADATVSHSAGHFAVVERPVVPPPPSPDWPELPSPTIPQSGFVDVSEGRRGLLLAAPGLPEVAVYPPRTEAEGAALYLTLLRGVGWLSRDDLSTRQGAAGPVIPTPGAQCLGRHVYRYALVPHSGGWEEVAGLGRAFAAPLRALPVDAHAGDLPPERSFVSVERAEPFAEAPAVVSAVKPARDGDDFVVRLYNPTSRDEEVRLRLAWEVSRATRCDLEEKPLGDLPLADGSSLILPIRGHEVVSVRLAPR